MRLRSPATLALIVCLSVAAAGVAAEAFTIKDQMNGTVDPQSKLIFTIGGEVDPANGPGQPPTTNARWAEASAAAAQLKIAAVQLQQRGVAKDRGLWMSDAKLLGATAAALERSANAKDGMDFSAAANTLGDVCTNCHSRYKPDNAG